MSLGRGATLYAAVRDKLLNDLDTPDQNHRYDLVERLCSLYRAANDKKIAGVADDLRAFAFKRFPELLKRHPNTPRVAGQPRWPTRCTTWPARATAFALLIESIENEPGWLR